MKKIKLFFMTIIAILVADVAFAQQITVKGTVYDAVSQEPVPSAAVMVKGSIEGTMIGTATDANGNYVINVPDAKTSELVFSSVGYKTQHILVNNKAVVDCFLEIDATFLDDVVVVAYGSSRREAVTGSVSSVKGSDIASAPITSVDKALSGKMAGVQVTANSSQPGSPSQIRIRGTSSIYAGNGPLWVVDGIPFTSGSLSGLNDGNGLSAINPNDIESITVLKDAAAAAVYGSRAANGVILVTTKNGQAGKAQFEVRVKGGVSWLQSDSGFRMMTADELLDYQRAAVVNAGLDPDDPTGKYYRPKSLLSGELTNWFGYLIKPGSLQEYEISARGGNKRSTYFTSLSFQKNKGITDGIDYSRVQARVNADYKLLDNLTTGARINVAYSDQNSVAFLGDLEARNPMWAGLNIPHWTPKFDENGEHFTDIPCNFNINPKIAPETNFNKSRTFKFNGTMFLRWEPIKHLVLETRNSAEMIFANERYYLSSKSTSYQKEDFAGSSMGWYANLTTSNTITYSNTFAGAHSMRVLIGQEANMIKSSGLSASGQGVDPKIPYVHTALPKNISTDYALSGETLLSFFAIADYNYDNRYFVQATVRGDGSSLFSQKTRWGAFGSGSLSWNISNEKWFENIHNVDLLKLRASYGLNGNNAIAPYAEYGLYGNTKYNGNTGYIPGKPGNPDLTWEKNATWNVGFDFSFFNRLRGSIDVYDRVTKDMLLNKKVPLTSGFASIKMNSGSLKNTGVEFQIAGDIIAKPDMVWTVGLNLAHNRTKLLDLGGEERIERSDFMHHVLGKTLYTFYLYDYYGVNPSNGEALWVTEEGKLTNDFKKARQYYAGSPEPKLLGGFNTSFNWKGLSISAFFEYKFGNYVFLPNENSYLNNDGKDLNNNQMASSLNYWKKPGDIGVEPKPVAGNTSNSNAALSDRWLQRGDYLRLKDLTVSYSLPENALQKMRIKGLRFYVSGLNLYCWNNVNFWDPELGLSGMTGGDYPLTKSVVGGIELTF